MIDPDDIFEKQKKILEEVQKSDPKENSVEDPGVDTLQLSESILNLTELADFGRQIAASARFCSLHQRHDLAVELLGIYIDEFDRIFEGYYTGIEDKEFIDAIAQKYGLSDNPK